MQAEDILQQGVPEGGVERRAQAGVQEAAGGREGGGGSGDAALQEALRATLLGTTRRAARDRQRRV